MALTPGSRLGPYEITAQIGVGGMGEVYRATDTNLKRQVAIKVLPASVAGDTERLARFQREAEVLAALNHPNIAAIYGLEKTPECTALVMELVEGEDLSQRIARGAIPADEALPIAKQIAEALEAAHEQGIIHRDLKPANIKVRADGTVKVLDFGLAKAMVPAAGSSPSLSMSPTITSPAMTQAGMILGTAAYMSPEQAKGRPVDRRADVWAFGAVLYEMLTGQRAFQGEDVTDLLVAVMSKEPAWDALPNNTPPTIRTLLRRCLDKNLRRRLGHVGEARIHIEDVVSGVAPHEPAAAAIAAAPRRPLWRRAVPVGMAMGLTAAIAGGAAWTLRPVPGPQPVSRFVLVVPEDQGFRGTGRTTIALSRDGSRLVYNIATGLYLRSLDQVEGRLMPGTEGAGLQNPFFSPDGQWVAYYQDRQIKKVAIAGGAPVTICQSVGSPLGMSWAEDNTIYFARPEGLHRVSANGGTPELIIKTTGIQGISGPQLLPGGEWVLFTLGTRDTGGWDRAQIVIQSLRSSERKVVVANGSGGQYVPTGHIVYAVGGALFAVPFDLSRLTVTGEGVAVVQGVRRAATGLTQAAISGTGTLLFVPGSVSTSAGSNIGLFDRDGDAELLKIQPGPYQTPRMSPDGTHIAFGSDDGKEASIWIYDLSGTSSMRRLTFEGQGRNRLPVWSPDSQRLAFQSDREKDLGIFWQRADGTGTAERLTTSEEGAEHMPESWAAEGADGEHLLYNVRKGDTTALWVLSLADKKAAPFGAVRSPARTLTGAVFSPDGRWVAYASQEGRDTSAVYVQPFPPTGARYQVSKDADDGHHPVWSPDGTELVFEPGAIPFLSSVRITTQPSFSFSEATPVPQPFQNHAPGSERPYDMSRDGKRFLGLINPSALQGEAAGNQIQIVLNWFEELRQKVPAGAN